MVVPGHGRPGFRARCTSEDRPPQGVPAAEARAKERYMNREIEAGARESWDGSEIAIIGMVGRFPGADDLDTFWRNLCAGVESIAPLSDDDLKASAVAPALLADPHYVKAAPILDDIESFDATFFGYSPREAEVMD